MTTSGSRREIDRVISKNLVVTVCLRLSGRVTVVTVEQLGQQLVVLLHFALGNDKFICILSAHRIGKNICGDNGRDVSCCFGTSLWATTSLFVSCQLIVSTKTIVVTTDVTHVSCYFGTSLWATASLFVSCQLIVSTKTIVVTTDVMSVVALLPHFGQRQVYSYLASSSYC